MNHPFQTSKFFSREQDSRYVVPLLFILAFFFTARLSHAHATAALFVLLLFLFGIRKCGIIPLKNRKNVNIYCLFIVFSLSGVVISAAWKETLLSFVLRLSFFLPFFLERKRDTLFAYALVGCLFGFLATLELLTGGGKTGYADASLFPALSRAAGVFGNPNLLAAFLLPSALLSLSELLFSSKNRLLFCIFFLGSSAGVVATFSRGAMLALTLASLLLLARRYGPFRLLAVSCAALPLISLLIPASVSARIASMRHVDSSVFYRFSLWKSILRVPKRSLFFGVGEGKGAMLSLLFPHLAAGLSHIEHTHSLYLHLLVSNGILGLFLFILLLLRALTGKGQIGVRAALSSLLIFGIFDDPLYSGQTEVLFWSLLGFCASDGDSLQASFSSSSHFSSLAPFFTDKN